MIYQLTTPVDSLVKGEKHTVLNVRENLTAGDVLAMRREKDTFEADLVLIGRLTGLDAKEVQALDLTDVVKLQAHARELFEAANPEGPETDPKG